MKKIFIPIIALIALSVSCKKSSSSPSTSASFTATINGTSKSFNIVSLATKTYLGGETGIGILGEANASTKENLVISIDNGAGGGVDSIVAGVISDTSSKFDIDVTYMVTSASGPEYEGGSDVDGFGAYSNHMTVTITSISKTAIKGTFSGNLYLNGDPTQAAWPVTNGSFSLPFTQQ